MCVSVLAAFIYCVPYMCINCEGRKRVLDPLELELRMVVSTV